MLIHEIKLFTIFNTSQKFIFSSFLLTYIFIHYYDKKTKNSHGLRVPLHEKYVFYYINMHCSNNLFVLISIP